MSSSHPGEGNYRIDRPIFRPRVVARMIEAAHQRGMKVVAWEPALTQPSGPADFRGGRAGG